MLERRAEPCGDQQGAELVAVQSDRRRVIIYPRPPDVRGRRVLEKFLLDGVLVEPRDGAQPPGHGRTGTAAGFQVAGEAFDVSAADGEQVQGAGAAPGSELAQVQRVGLSCQPAIPGQEAGEREPLGVAECRLERDKGGCGGGHRVPPGPG